MVKLLNIILILVMTFIVAVQSATPSIAEYNPKKLALAAGQYLYVVAQMELLGSSECSYIQKKNYNTGQVIEEMASYFESKHRTAFIERASTENIFSTAKADFEGYFEAGRRDGLDIKTLCGLYLGISTNMFTKVEREYQLAIESYSSRQTTSPTNVCSEDNLDNCTDERICEIATKIINKNNICKLEWSTQKSRQPFVNQAKNRGLLLGIQCPLIPVRIEGKSTCKNVE